MSAPVPARPPADGGGIPRRSFLGTGLAGLAAAAAAPAAVLGAGSEAGSARPSAWPLGPRWELTAARVPQTFQDGTTAPFFRFQAAAGAPVAGTVPVLTGKEGSLGYLSITNTLDRDIQPHIVGMGRGPRIAAGASRDLLLRIPRAGTWLLTDALLGRAAGPVGLGAVLVSRPGRRTPLAAGRIDRTYVLLYQDADERWNLDVDAGLEPDMHVYEPNLHTLNGLSFPDTTGDPTTVIACNVGERVLLRLANLGHVRHAIHFHGYHVDVIERNRVRETAWPAKDTVPLPGYSTTDVVLNVDQPGMYPVHPHTLTSVTANGLYAHGQITLIQAT